MCWIICVVVYYVKKSTVQYYENCSLIILMILESSLKDVMIYG